MNLDNISIYYKGNTINEFVYSINDEVFCYNVFTRKEVDKIYKYTEKEHKEIQKLKEDKYWDRLCNASWDENDALRIIKLNKSDIL